MPLPSRGTSTTSSLTCRACAAGFYKPLLGRQACEQCIEGKFSDVVAATSEDVCQTCTPGKYTTTPGQAECQWCEPGKYQMQSGLGVAFQGRDCFSCPEFANTTYGVLNYDILDCFCTAGHEVAQQFRSLVGFQGVSQGFVDSIKRRLGAVLRGLVPRVLSGQVFERVLGQGRLSLQIVPCKHMVVYRGRHGLVRLHSLRGRDGVSAGKHFVRGLCVRPRL